MQYDGNSGKENSEELVNRLTGEALFQKIKKRKPTNPSLFDKKVGCLVKPILRFVMPPKVATDLICCSTPQSALISSPPACSKKIPPCLCSSFRRFCRFFV
jgi:hypothetical protein